MSKMMSSDIRQALLHLTALRKRVQEANDVVGRLFANFSDDKSTPPSRDELVQAEKDLELQVPEFYVWFEPRHARYALIPKTDRETGEPEE